MGTRLAGYSGLTALAVLVLAFALDLALMVTTGGPPQLFAGTIGADLARAGASTLWPVELSVYVAAMVPFVVFLPGLAAAFRERAEALAGVGTLAGVAFIAFHTIHNMAYLAVVAGLAPSYAPGTPAALATEQAARALVAFAETAFLPGGGIGGALQVVMLVALGIAQRNAGSRGTSWLAFASAALSAVGFARVLAPDAPVLPVVLLGWIAFLVWTGATAVGLLRADVAPLGAMRTSAAAAG